MRLGNEPKNSLICASVLDAQAGQNAAKKVDSAYPPLARVVA